MLHFFYCSISAQMQEKKLCKTMSRVYVNYLCFLMHDVLPDGEIMPSCNMGLAATILSREYMLLMLQGTFIYFILRVWAA